MVQCVFTRFDITCLTESAYSLQSAFCKGSTVNNKNSSKDEIANVNFYAVHPEDTRIRRNNAK